MALELALSPIMVPVALTGALFCHFHRQASHYSPRIIPLDGSKTTVYAIVPVKKDFTPESSAMFKDSDMDILSKLLPQDYITFQVIDVKKNVVVYELRQSNKMSHAVFDLVAVTDTRHATSVINSQDVPSNTSIEAFRLKKTAPPSQTNIEGTSEVASIDEDSDPTLEEVKEASKSSCTDDNTQSVSAQDECIATVSAGIWSKINVRKPVDNTRPELYLGINNVIHQSDFLDNYRLFTLSDGLTYQWTKRGMFLERVYNLGQKDSEVRERCGRAIMLGNANVSITMVNGSNKLLNMSYLASEPLARSDIGASRGGFLMEIDETKMGLEVALTTAFVSYLDHWNTLAGIGGVYYSMKTGGSGEVPWRRIARAF